MINRLHMKRFFIVMALLPILFINIGNAAAQDRPGDNIPTDCTFEGYDLGLSTMTGEMLGFECGFVVVPERHENPDGPTIRIPYAIHRATGDNVRPDPLVVAQGGPGGDAFKIFTLLTASSEISLNRDIIVFNQRGTPYAQPELTCPETDEVLPEMLAASSEEGEQIYNEAIDACYARLQGEGIDLSAFNSLQNAADIPMLVRALGYDEYNFYGVSYATLLGLHLMRNHPEGLRSVILDSVVPPEINFIQALPESEDRVLREIFTSCAADPVCREQYPDLENRYFALVRLLNEKPITLTITDPETGDDYEALLDGTGLRGLAFLLLYTPGMSAALPKMVADMEQGDTRYLQLMWPLLAFDQSIAEGMYYSVVCAEDADIEPDTIPLGDLYPEIAATAIGDLQGYKDNCRRWQVDQLDSSVDDPVISDIPTLLFSGGFDPVTPPAFAASAAAGLQNAFNIVDPLSAHGNVFMNPCSTGIATAFLDDPTVAPDTNCLTEQVAPAFVPPNAITVPMLASINSPTSGIIAFFIVAGLLLFVILSTLIVWPAVFIIRAFGQNKLTRSPEDRRARLFSRIVVLVFVVLAVAFVSGFLGFVIYTLATEQTFLVAMSLPPAAAPVLWLPVILLVLALIVVVAAILLWRRTGSSTTLGKIYYSIVALAAVGFVIALATQGLLRPPL